MTSEIPKTSLLYKSIKAIVDHPDQALYSTKEGRRYLDITKINAFFSTIPKGDFEAVTDKILTVTLRYMEDHPETLNDRVFSDFYKRWKDKVTLPNMPVSPKLANMLSKHFPNHYFTIEKTSVTNSEEVFENVTHIKVYPSTSDDELQDLVRKFPSLRSVDLSNCTQITDAGLAHLRGLTSLENLNLHGCVHITDAGLAHLRGLIFLKDLNLSDCYKITDEGLAHLRGLISLEKLDLSRCYKITDAELKNLANLLPSCRRALSATGQNMVV